MFLSVIMLRSFIGRDVISIREFSLDELVYIVRTAQEIKTNWRNKEYAHLLDGVRIGYAFFEPSTRTRTSFVSAAELLGAKTFGFSSGEGTSLLKGESFRHTLEMLACYKCDAIVVRDGRDGAAQYAADFLTIPVINGGDGKREHPTQAMLDLMTITELHDHCDNLNIGIAGDLKYSRTVRSLIGALQHIPGITFTFISPTELRPLAEETRLSQAGIPIRWYDNYDSSLRDLDILYVTRIQEEKYPDKAEYEKVADRLQLTPEIILRNAKPTMRILHPLPINTKRFPEIHPLVDDLLVPGTNTQYAYYKEQAGNGLYARMALFCLLMGKRGKMIMDLYMPQHHEKKSSLEPLPVSVQHREPDRIIGYIENGTVIDHLEPSAVEKIKDLLAIPEDTLYLLGKNFSSTKKGKKGVIKIVGYTPTTEQLNRIAVLSPNATVSHVKNGQVVEKGRVTLPSIVENIIECINPMCISRHEQKEYVKSIFYMINSNNTFQCHYCDSVISGERVRLR